MSVFDEIIKDGKITKERLERAKGELNYKVGLDDLKKNY